MKRFSDLTFRSLVLLVLFISCIGHPTQMVHAIDSNPVPEPELGFDSQTTCNVLLEPIRPGASNSRILKLDCEVGSQVSSPIAIFYDNTGFDKVLFSYYGPTQCSATVSYGVGQLSSTFDNRISSGSGYSGCNNIFVYDSPNYAGDSVSCFANCSSFGSLNDRVSSWSVTN
jgi:hypothetical protein